MATPYIATQIPIGSRLKITVAATTPGRLFTSSGELEAPAPPTHHFSDSELADGTSVTLDTDGPYPGFIDVVFAKPSAGTVTIDLTDPAGNPVRPTFVEPVAGGAGQIQTVFLFLEV